MTLRHAAALGAFAALPLSAHASEWRALGDHVYVSGQRGPADPDPAAQVRGAFDKLAATLGQAGLALDRVVELRIALADVRHYALVDQELRARFPARPPATTAYEVGLLEAGAVVELVAVAARAGVEITAIEPPGWPKPKAHFSRALRAGDTLFVAGQVGYDPVSGREPAAIGQQAAQALANVKTLVEAAGLTMENVVACRAFLADPRDFAEMNTAWRAVFAQAPPVRETIGAKLGAEVFRVEMACTAVAGKKTVIGEQGSAPYSPAIAVPGRVYTSGKVARGDSWPATAEEQARVILDKLRADLALAGLEPRHVVDSTVFVSDIRLADAVKKPWAAFFGSHQVTLTFTGAPLMTPEALVEISFIAEHPAKP